MTQAIIPLIKYIIFLLITFFIGCNAVSLKKEPYYSTILKAFVFGQMILFALTQIIALPLILLRRTFNTLFWIFIIISLFLFIRGLYCFINRGNRFPSMKGSLKDINWPGYFFLFLAMILILFQFGNYLFRMHLDEDDARWLAEANDALAYGEMMTHNPSTGEIIGSFYMPKDVSSPLPMYYAILSRILNTRVTITAHTLYAPFALILMYVVYYLIARELFDKKESRAVFLLAVAVINLFFGGNTRPQSVVSLTRIWQGKATVAAIILPLITYVFICIHKRDETADWLMMFIIGCASCLMSGMGIAMAAVLTGVFGLYDILVYQRWKRIPLWLFSLIPSTVSALIYFFIKG